MKKAEAFKELLRDSDGYYNAYYDFVNDIISATIKEHIKDLHKPDWDLFETPDNIAADLFAMYRVLRYYLTTEEYDQFVKEMQCETRSN